MVVVEETLGDLDTRALALSLTERRAEALSLRDMLFVQELRGEAEAVVLLLPPPGRVSVAGAVALRLAAEGVVVGRGEAEEAGVVLSVGVENGEALAVFVPAAVAVGGREGEPVGVAARERVVEGEGVALAEARDMLGRGEEEEGALGVPPTPFSAKEGVKWEEEEMVAVPQVDTLGDPRDEALRRREWDARGEAEVLAERVDGLETGGVAVRVGETEGGPGIVGVARRERVPAGAEGLLRMLLLPVRENVWVGEAEELPLLSLAVALEQAEGRGGV